MVISVIYIPLQIYNKIGKYKFNLPKLLYLFQKMRWGLADYLDVLTVLSDTTFIYFTSNKSSIVELCDWMGKHPDMGNPFKDARRIEFNARVNYGASYTDIMLYKTAMDGQSNKAA